MKKSHLQTNTKSVHLLWNGLVLSIIAAAVFAGGMAAFAQKAHLQRLQMENVYEKSLAEVSDNLANMEVKLSKLLVCNDNVQSVLLANDIWRQADNTATNLSQLPLQHNSIAQTTKYVNQLGDYVYSLGKNLTGGGKITEEQADILAQMHKRCQDTSEVFNGMLDRVNKNYKIIDHANYERLPKNRAPFSDGFDQMEKNSVDYPKMIYDGPFSDSTEERTFAAIKDKQEVSQDVALTVATKMLNGQAKSIEFLGEAGGDLKTCEFLAKTSSGTVYAQVTKQGGYPLLLSADRNVARASLGEEQATKIAESYLTELGFESMKAVWYNGLDRIAYINLAPIVNGITIYPDLVKVKVALDNGEILGLESMAYLCNHDNARQIDSLTISQNTAKSMVNKRLEVKSLRPALIPKDNREILTYELECSYQGMDYFVYVDAYDGRQVDILRLVNGLQGKMLN